MKILHTIISFKFQNYILIPVRMTQYFKEFKKKYKIYMSLILLFYKQLQPKTSGRGRNYKSLKCKRHTVQIHADFYWLTIDDYRLTIGWVYIYLFRDELRKLSLFLEQCLQFTFLNIKPDYQGNNCYSWALLHLIFLYRLDKIAMYHLNWKIPELSQKNFCSYS